MSDRGDVGPSRHIWFDTDEALDLLADLEDAREALAHTTQLAALLRVEEQIRLLSHKLGFDTWEGGSNGS